MPQPLPLNPAGLPKLPGVISHGVALGQIGLVYTSGQVAWDENGELVGRGDFAAQFAKAYQNVDLVLAAAGSARDRIVKETIYVVGYRTENAEELVGLIAASRTSTTPPASTCVGVETLYAEGFLVEIEVVATL